MFRLTDRLGEGATIRRLGQMGNKANTTPGGRRGMQKGMQKLVGVHAERPLPPYAPPRFAKLAPESRAWPVKDGERTPGKVAIFSTCYVNYNEPGIGLDMIRVLEHN